MPLSKSLFSYKDCEEICARAMAAPRGIKVTTESPKYLRDRIYAYRKMQRAENRKVFTENDPLYDRTPYDELMFQVEGQTLTILNSRGKVERLVIEDLDGEVE